MKTIQCRAHGGTFTVPSRRGRPPTSCNPEKGYQCDAKNRRVQAEGIARAVAKTLKGSLPAAAGRRKVADEAPERASEATKSRSPNRGTNNPGLTPAMEAKTLLERLGWVVSGKAWREDDVALASVTATRGEENIALLWRDGVLVKQHYSLWNVDKPSVNGKPASDLPFNPDEVTDTELVRLLSGMQVTWWNRIGKKEEKATIPSKIVVQHCYDGTGEETPGARIISFWDVNQTGYHSFRLDALMKIGR